MSGLNGESRTISDNYIQSGEYTGPEKDAYIWTGVTMFLRLFLVMTKEQITLN